MKEENGTVTIPLSRYKSLEELQIIIEKINSYDKRIVLYNGYNNFSIINDDEYLSMINSVLRHKEDVIKDLEAKVCHPKITGDQFEYLNRIPLFRFLNKYIFKVH